MEIKKEQNGASLAMSLSGRLDTVAATGFEKELEASLEGVSELVIDCAELTYVASSGLRAFLMAQKRMNKQGSMVMRHVQEPVMEVLSMTGFDDLLSIEK
ncbi:MAG: STAS domain-containing protein [Schwartzia sp.]|nr:STAS domain-containing protein [Schwartzia sp. (in: firmicutes)]MBR1885739.1 STAS domain-containing protein [Schwartzia sp. (in: firmicutes)]